MIKTTPWYKMKHADQRPHPYFESVYHMIFFCKSCDYKYSSFDASFKIESACPKCKLKHIEQKEVR